MNFSIRRFYRYKPEVITSLDNFLKTRNNSVSKAVCLALNLSFWFRQKVRRNKIQPKVQKEPSSQSSSKVFIEDIIRFHFPSDNFNINELSCTVVIPVYNGLKHLKRLTSTLFVNSDPRCKFLFIDDASTDPSVGALLKSLTRRQNVTLLTNKENLGFLGSVNKAMSCVETEYAILLNTDTEVPPMWIPRMIKPFLMHSKIATTTPFTNSGVTFSFPKFGIDNQICLTVEEIDKAFQVIYCNSPDLLRTYSGTGFCMAINMNCWHEIGNLNEAKFGKGYGEENDWCFRATQAGWKHELVCNLFVMHYHGGSFLSEEKKQLISSHLDILKKEYPDFMERDVPIFFKEDPWKKFRLLAALQLSKNNSTLYIDLRLDKNSKSGAKGYSQKQIQLLRKEGESILLLDFDISSNSWELRSLNFDVGYPISLSSLEDISLLLKMISIKKIIVNNLAFYKNLPELITTICKIKANQNCRLEYRWHDFLPVCPSFFLIGKDGLPCNINPRFSCTDCIKENKNCTIQWNKSIEEWRNLFKELFLSTNEVRFFSDYSKSIAINYFPILESKSIVVEHAPLINNNSLSYLKPKIEDLEKINFCFVGNFTEVKGSKQYIDFAKHWLSNHPNSKFFILGLLNDELPSFISYIGPYERLDLANKLNEYSIHMVINPSLANETFSYTSQELMLMNVPLVVYSCGAPAERIKRENYEFGMICYQFDIQSLEIAVTNLLLKLTTNK